MDSKLWILLNPVTDLVQKHSETALDTTKNESAESSFPIKVHVIPGKIPAICKFLGGAAVVQKGKRKMQVFDFQALAFCLVPCGLPVFEPVYGRLGTNI